MSDSRLDALAESARNRGLKLIRSRVRTPGKRRFGKVGLADPGGKAIFGLDSKGPAATPEQAEDYLRNLGATDWGASLDAATRVRKRGSRKPSPAANDETAKSKPKPKPTKPIAPQIRAARPADSGPIAALIALLGHPIAEPDVRKNLAALARLGEAPLVATLGKRVVGLAGVHRMVVVHRDAPVGRIPILVVAEDARGRGIGRMLVEAAEKQLREAGCKLVEITSNDRLAQAHAFYRHLGFERTSLRFVKTL